MSLREEQCNKVCRILDNVLANRPTERDSLIVAVRKAFKALAEPSQVAADIARIVENGQDMRVIAQPERIKGHWVDDCTYMGIQCSACGKSLQDYIHATEYAELMEVPNYCPNCGSDNRGATECLD